MGLVFRLVVGAVSLMPLLSCSETDRLRIGAYLGDSRAQSKLGRAYAIGEGVSRDDALAAEWYRKAAEQGNSRAQFRLGFMYDVGDGVPEDNEQAVEWYRKAAEQGLAKAQLMLGVMYKTGEGVPKDLVQAHKWMNLAAHLRFESAPGPHDSGKRND